MTGAGEGPGPGPSSALFYNYPILPGKTALSPDAGKLFHN